MPGTRETHARCTAKWRSEGDMVVGKKNEHEDAAIICQFPIEANNNHPDIQIGCEQIPTHRGCNAPSRPKKRKDETRDIHILQDV